jgi:hypothetical protein
MGMSFHENEAGRPNWRKSSLSVNNGNCTEVASGAGMVMVRDSQDPETVVLRYPANAWKSFLGAARTGALDSVR